MAEAAIWDVYHAGPVEDFSVRARTRAWLDGLATACGLAAKVGMVVHVPEKILPRLLYCASQRADKKVKKRTAAASPVLETGVYGPGPGSSRDDAEVQKVFEHGDDDTVHAVVAAAGLTETDVVVPTVDPATSAELTESVIDMIRPRLESIGVAVVGPVVEGHCGDALGAGPEAVSGASEEDQESAGRTWTARDLVSAEASILEPTAPPSKCPRILK
jgi:hypothetical protein